MPAFYSCDADPLDASAPAPPQQQQSTSTPTPASWVLPQQSEQQGLSAVVSCTNSSPPASSSSSISPESLSSQSPSLTSQSLSHSESSLSPSPSPPISSSEKRPQLSQMLTSPASSAKRFPQHRGRSRSLPNLMFFESKVHKRRDTSLPVKTSSRRNKKRNTNSSSNQIILASNVDNLPTSTNTIMTSAMTTSTDSTLLPVQSSPTSSSSSWVQPPPVNAMSLREIDLQEIFKNPQLRHDIVFDPQLQFRPNLDGERGKRKKLLAEKYWDSIVIDCQNLVSGNSSNSPKLVLLFNTLREILLSLLPVTNRAYVDSVLDPDLLIQQVRHSALDFLGLAKWLSSVFKAHCAPMRDSWVDQMVSRIELGISTKSPKRLVEGLRMVFAILEAMKLDVANHQIRTLRPMLVDSAIEFEQEYYNQITSKGKIDFTNALVWYKQCSVKFQATNNNNATTDINRSVFIFGLLKLLSCASDDMVSEFPSTFGFDLYRLAGFRAEVRKVVCLHLAITLYQQIMTSEISKAGLNSHEARQLASQVLSPEAITKVKNDILAIISDSSGNAKWTKNTHTLSLEFAKRIEEAVTKKPSNIPSQRLVDLCSGWLSKHLQPRSEVYKLLESKTINNLYNAISIGITAIGGLDNTVLASGLVNNPIPEGPVSKETVSLADRILVLVKFHWGVFGKYYSAYITMSEEEVSASAASALLLARASSNDSEDGDEDDDLEMTQASSSDSEAVGANSISSGRMRQPSTC